MTQRYQKVQECVLSFGNVLPFGKPFDKGTLNECLNKANEAQLLNVGWGNITLSGIGTSVANNNLDEQTSIQTIGFPQTEGMTEEESAAIINDFLATQPPISTDPEQGNCYFNNTLFWPYTPDQRCLREQTLESNSTQTVSNSSTATSITAYRRIVNDITKLEPLTSSKFDNFIAFGTQWAWGIRLILATDGTNIFFTDPEADPKLFRWRLVEDLSTTANSDGRFFLQSESQAFIATVKTVGNSDTISELQLTHDQSDPRVIKWNLTEDGQLSTIINGQKRALIATTPVSTTFPPIKVELGITSDAKNLTVYQAEMAPFDSDKTESKLTEEVAITTIIFIIAILIILALIFFINRRPKPR